MGNETSAPDPGTAAEEIASGAGILGVGATSSANQDRPNPNQSQASAPEPVLEPKPELAHQLHAPQRQRRQQQQQQQQQAVTGVGGSAPTLAASSYRPQQMQQQMKERVTKGMTSARSMFQRSSIGGAAVGGGGHSAGPSVAGPRAFDGQQQQQRQSQQRQQQAHGQHGEPSCGNGGYAGQGHVHPAPNHYRHDYHQQMPPPPSSSSPGYSQKRGSSVSRALVDVMYATEGRGHSDRSIQSGQRPMVPALAAPLGQQMQNMSLSTSAPGLASAAHTAAAAVAAAASSKTTGLSNDEDEWQAAWEEDDESSGDEECPDDGVGGCASGSLSGPLSAGPAMAASSLPAATSGPVQPFRVSMDGGHSSSSPVKRVGSAVAIAPPPPSQMQQQQKYSLATSNPPPRPSEFADAVVTPHETEEEVLTKEADKVLGEGLVWDTAVPPLPSSDLVLAGGAMDGVDEKPSVQMFFPLLRVLGKGSFGKVVLVQKRTGKERGGLFAMKILRKAHLVKRRQIERTKTERKVLAIVDHPFIMKLHFAFQTEDKLYLVLDYCPGGELFFHLSRYRRFPERVARFYAAELLLAIGHLHKKGIIYRDLKPENVLLDADGHVKLGDFGLAKDNISHPCAGANSMCGTPEYMAPEVLSQSGHGFCVDYWGLGMLVYEMMTGLPPWYTTDRTKLFRRLKSAPLDIPTYFSVQSASYVGALLERNPRKRLGVFGIKSAMQHEFFREIDWRVLRDRRIEAPIRPCEGWKSADPSRNDEGGLNVVLDSDASLHQSGDSGQKQISQNELDVATANFDQTFTRMAVNTEDAGNGTHSGDEGDSEELHASTFVGFTFDEKDTAHSRKVETGRARGAPASSNPQAYASQRN